MQTKVLDVGVIARPHGVRGMTRVRLFDAGSDSLGLVERVLLDGEERRLESASRDKDAYLVKLAGVDDRDAADALRGRTVRVYRDDLPGLDEDELYLVDLVGCEVVDGAGAPLGIVKRIEIGGPQQLLVLARGDGEALVPFVEPIVRSVDVEGRRIVCDPPEGLIDPEAGR